MQGGDQCYYGTDLGSAIAQGASTACTATCACTKFYCAPGTLKSTGCGGSNANSVYTIV